MSHILSILITVIHHNILGEPIPFRSGNVCKKEVEVSQDVHLKNWLCKNHERIQTTSCSNKTLLLT